LVVLDESFQVIVKGQIFPLLKTSLTKPHGKLRKVFAGAPLDLVAIDILSGMPVTPDGLKYVLVVTDYFSKWTEAYALPDAEASTCMQVLYNQFSAGLPRQLHSAYFDTN